MSNNNEKGVVFITYQRHDDEMLVSAYTDFIKNESFYPGMHDYFAFVELTDEPEKEPKATGSSLPTIENPETGLEGWEVGNIFCLETEETVTTTTTEYYQYDGSNWETLGETYEGTILAEYTDDENWRTTVQSHDPLPENGSVVKINTTTETTETINTYYEYADPGQVNTASTCEFVEPREGEEEYGPNKYKVQINVSDELVNRFPKTRYFQPLVTIDGKEYALEVLDEPIVFYTNRDHRISIMWEPGKVVESFLFTVNR